MTENYRPGVDRHEVVARRANEQLKLKKLLDDIDLHSDSSEKVWECSVIISDAFLKADFNKLRMQTNYGDSDTRQQRKELVSTLLDRLLEKLDLVIPQNINAGQGDILLLAWGTNAENYENEKLAPATLELMYVDSVSEEAVFGSVWKLANIYHEDGSIDVTDDIEPGSYSKLPMNRRVVVGMYS